jgi:hypothetical protein
MFNALADSAKAIGSFRTSLAIKQSVLLMIDEAISRRWQSTAAHSRLSAMGGQQRNILGQLGQCQHQHVANAIEFGVRGAWSKP